MVLLVWKTLIKEIIGSTVFDSNNGTHSHIENYFGKIKVTNSSSDDDMYDGFIYWRKSQRRSKLNRALLEQTHKSLPSSNIPSVVFLFMWTLKVWYLFQTIFLEFILIFFNMQRKKMPEEWYIVYFVK
jgi:hypothetical protein